MQMQTNFYQIKSKLSKIESGQCKPRCSIVVDINMLHCNRNLAFNANHCVTNELIYLIENKPIDVNACISCREFTEIINSKCNKKKQQQQQQSLCRIKTIMEYDDNDKND